MEKAEEASSSEVLGDARRLLQASCITSTASALMIVADIARRCEQKACGAMETAEWLVEFSDSSEGD